jgi:hypothetical protein
MRRQASRGKVRSRKRTEQKRGAAGEGNEDRKSEKGRGTCLVSQTREVRTMGSIIPITEEDESGDPMTIQAKNEAKEKISTWARDQIALRDAEMMRLARGRQRGGHEKAQIRRWQMRAIEACMQILRGENGVTINKVMPRLIVWADQDG